MEWMILPLKKYAQFSGRSRRMEYWMFVLFVVIVSTVLQTIEGALGLGGRPLGTGVGMGGNGPLSGLFGLAIFVPGLAVAVRRLHDIDRSGWWVLAPVVTVLVVIVGAVVTVMQAAGNTGVGGASPVGFVGAVGLFLIVYFVVLIGWIVVMCLPGTKGPNRFGPDPLNPDGDLGEVFS